jgi:hypothetical protein
MKLETQLSLEKKKIKQLPQNKNNLLLKRSKSAMKMKHHKSKSLVSFN